ncbi:hypothetical protein F4782DRAFT_392173 [Xylaria castorea]|nr:hypothetical protein F4782DRAFT_392173 [Xylaria castorea]
MSSTTIFLSMISLIWITLIPFVPVVAGQSAGQFFNPPQSVPGTHDYSTNPVYFLGKAQTIKFTTVYPNYQINLWQQTRGQDAATKGPSVFTVENGAVTQFDWQVQLYQFDLSASNLFFLWLTSTNENDDGTDTASVSSHYFNISDNPDTSDSSSSTPSLTSTTLPTQSSTPSLLPSETTTTTSLPIATSSQNSAPGGLNTGAKAGIGVGAGLAGVAIITLSLLLFRRSGLKRSYKAPDQFQASETLAWGDVPMVHDASPQGFKAQTVPAELG